MLNITIDAVAMVGLGTFTAALASLIWACRRDPSGGK